MIEINFNVTETEVIFTDQRTNLTAGNVNQIKCFFNLSKEYDGLIIKAVFGGVACTVENGICYAPELSEGRCLVGIYGYSVSDEKIVCRISPHPCLLYIKKGSYCMACPDTEEEKPSASELEQHYNLIKELVDSGKLKGEKGDKGDPGPQGEPGVQGEQGPPGEITDGSVTTEKLADAAVTNEKIADYSLSIGKLENAQIKNLFPGVSLIEGGWINSASNIATGSATWDLTSLITEGVVSEGEYYFTAFDFEDNTTGYRVIVYCYDSDGTYLGTAASDTGQLTQFKNTSPKSKHFTLRANTAAIRIQLYQTLRPYNNCQFVLTSDFKTNTYIEKYELPYVRKDEYSALVDTLAEDVKELVNDCDLKVVTANNDSEAEALLADISSNLASYSPVLLLVTYDGSETIGLNTGDGYMIIDSGTGSMDDAYLIPHIASEVNFSNNDKSKLDNAEKFITDYPQSVLWKAIPYSTLNSVTQYTNGTYMSKMPLREFIASIDLDFFEGATVPSSGLLTVCTYSLSGMNTNNFQVDQDIVDLGSVLLKIHGIVIESGYLITFSIFKGGAFVFEDEKIIIASNSDFSEDGSRKFYLYATSDSYAAKTVNYVYGRS